jgi:hypothetical protein
MITAILIVWCCVNSFLIGLLWRNIDTVATIAIAAGVSLGIVKIKKKG